MTAVRISSGVDYWLVQNVKNIVINKVFASTQLLRKVKS